MNFPSNFVKSLKVSIPSIAFWDVWTISSTFLWGRNSFMSKPRNSICCNRTTIDFFKLTSNPNWVRRKIVVSLLINNYSSDCGRSNMFSRYITTRVWSLLKREIGTFKILVNMVGGAGLDQNKDRGLLVRACTFSRPSGAYFVINLVPTS